MLGGVGKANTCGYPCCALKICLVTGVVAAILGAIGFSRPGFEGVFKQSYLARNVTFISGLAITVSTACTLFYQSVGSSKKDPNQISLTDAYEQAFAAYQSECAKSCGSSGSTTNEEEEQKYRVFHRPTEGILKNY